MPDDEDQDHLIVSFEPASLDCSVYQENAINHSQGDGVQIP